MGKQISQSIVIDAKVRTTLEGMNEVVSKLNQGLREGTTKVDLTKGIGSSLSKNLDKFKDEYSKFSKFIEGGKIEFADAKDVVKSGEALIKTFREMKRIVGDFDDLSVIDAKKLFPDAFDSRVTDLLGGLDKLSSAMAKFESKQIDLAAAQTEMQDLRDKAKELEVPLKQGVYMQLTGPAYESPAEVRMCRLLGADAVGMSTACEAVAANHMQMKICGISCISNLACGMTEQPLSHKEVQEAADQAAPMFRKLVREVIIEVGKKHLAH